MQPGKQLRAWRVEHNVTQTAAAKAVGVRQGSWCEWESGNRRPSVHHAVRIEALTKGALPAAIWAKAPSATELARMAQVTESAPTLPDSGDEPATGTEG